MKEGRDHSEKAGKGSKTSFRPVKVIKTPIRKRVPEKLFRNAEKVPLTIDTVPLEIVDDLADGEVRTINDPGPCIWWESPHIDGPKFGPDDSIQDLLAIRAQYRGVVTFFLAYEIERAYDDPALSAREKLGVLRGAVRDFLLTFEARLGPISARIRAKARMAGAAGKTRSHAKARAVFATVVVLVRKDRLSLEEASRVLAERGKKPRRGRPKAGTALSWGRIRSLVLEERRRRVWTRACELLGEGVHEDDVPVQIEEWSVAEPTMIPVTRETVSKDLAAVKK